MANEKKIAVAPSEELAAAARLAYRDEFAQPFWDEVAQRLGMTTTPESTADSEALVVPLPRRTV